MPHIALYQPEIPPNTGNIIRLAANTGFHLHLIHPLGFQLDNKKMQRAGLDYHQLSIITQHDNFEIFYERFKSHRIFACTTKATRLYTDVHYQSEDVLLFGPETRGLPESVRHLCGDEFNIKIPMLDGSRSLNLANAVAVITYESWRQLNFTAN